MTDSPYARIGAKLVDQGYAAIPCGPGTKAPGQYSLDRESGEFRWWPRFGWDCYGERLPTEFETRIWSTWPDAGICVVLDHTVKVVDVDTDDPALRAAIEAVLPDSPVKKRGLKGYSAFFRGSPEIAARSYNIGQDRVVDLLAFGKQTVVPPTIHPDSGQPYAWIGDETLVEVTPDELPALPDDIGERIAAALAPHGYMPKIERSEVDGGGSGLWRDVNDAAMARLDDWVPALGLDRLERNRDGSYRSVASYRPSGSGKPLDKRNLHLSIHHHGIVDYGDNDRTFTPIDLAATAQAIEPSEAVEWLRSQLGIERDPPPTFAKLIANGLAKHAARQDRPEDRTGDPEPEPETPAEPVAPEREQSAKPTISATPFEWLDPSSLPRREFVYGRHLVRRYVSVTVAPGGVGKSSLTIVEALSMATGRILIGVKPPRPMRVWLYNGEDSRDELNRRIMAACVHYNITPDEIGDRLYVDSGRETEIVIARDNKRQIEIAVPVVKAVKQTIRDNGIDVTTIDPFVSTHGVPENDNGAIDRVAKLWAQIADETDTAIDIVHHVRKVDGREVAIEDARGAGSLINAARSVRVLNRMSEEQATAAGIGIDDRLSIFSVLQGKANLTQMTGRAEWMRLASVGLGNGQGLTRPQDHAGVVTQWEWPSAESAIADVTADQLDAIKVALRNRNHAASDQVRNLPWAGEAIAYVLKLTLDEPANKKKVQRMLKAWQDQGTLVKVDEMDEVARKMRPFIRPAEET